MIFRDLRQLHGSEDKDCFFERKWKPSEFIILWNTYSGTPFFFLTPTWETCLLSSLKFPHLWLKLFLSKTAISSPTQIKCFKSQDINSVITVSMYLYQNSPLVLRGAGESKGRRWAEVLSQHCLHSSPSQLRVPCKRTWCSHRCHQRAHST